jgi:competence protein ComEC
LVDGGPDPQKIALELSRKMPFWDRTIELVVLTHPHADHLTGLVEVLKRYRVIKVLAPRVDHDSALYNEFKTIINNKNISATCASAGQIVRLGGNTEIEVLAPLDYPPTTIEPEIDRTTVVLRLKTGSVSFLLASDVSADMESELLLDRAQLNSTVLKVGHHGSNGSSSAQFLKVANPQLAVISVGRNNQFNHPGAETVDRLNVLLGKDRLYRTDVNGTVELITDGNRLWVKTDR